MESRKASVSVVAKKGHWKKDCPKALTKQKQSADQENVQGDEEVMVSSEGDTNINENVMIPNEATVQDPPSLKQSKRVIRKSSRYLFVRESKQAISIEQVDDSNSYKEAINDVYADLWRLAMNTKIESMYSNQV
ncbi:Gag/pol protein [Abeliophyllum distichum]|uniref:Gag/pol protein n=1 Tax=Abeliophyllum distichum TaxID=126358 RepID=A0ABD1UN12_9LAMI